MIEGGRRRYDETYNDGYSEGYGRSAYYDEYRTPDAGYSTRAEPAYSEPYAPPYESGYSEKYH
ncbi:MAG: hypothetical protein KAJ51_07710, partial [Thermoplasmata archaeon]|nr:hypothetical protein [Thermoplasmata archaeon]